LLAARPIAFLAAQAGIAGLLALGGAAEPWWASAAWWPVAAIFGNVVGLGLLEARATADGVPLRRLVLGGGFRRGDAAPVALVLPLLALTALGVPWAWGLAVWGDVGVGLAVLASPLPLWAAGVALLAYPLSMAAVDLPTYAYARARLHGGALTTVAIGVALGVQHAALPFLPAWTFVEWRTLMWVPYGLAVVGLLTWRPRWLPWLAVVHGLVHAAAAVLVWRASI
jgi:hypothetical protein